MSIELLAQGLGKSFLLVLAALMPILNPAASAPVFLGLTEGAAPRVRRHLARLIARNVVMLMMGAMLIGSYVLDFFNLSLPIVRVGGGIVLIANAWRMLNAVGPGQDKAPSFSPTSLHVIRQLAFYPLTFPVTCGPASISIGITVGVAMNSQNLYLTVANTIGGAIAVCVIGITTYYAFAYASRLLVFLGETGTAVFLRLSAFILLCIGIEIFWQGAGALVRGLGS
ncbi:MarC family protein [Propionivibrio dicarboxylicus]|uniref:UPF0056 membrane protein n=1 Tax=Propionivibrio dicarboxylicus TaxID=83767 RepID=A0A1G7XW83_9RHOO|nr:MarC family protein [Propionivibrio dicarboxylicus]SDG88458.1 multiple antibiotic resistance protein [Propionivibrio dicarboxylicus]